MNASPERSWKIFPALTFVIGLVIGMLMLAAILSWSPKMSFNLKLAEQQISEVRKLAKKCQKGKIGSFEAKLLIKAFKSFSPKKFGVEGICSKKKLEKAIVYGGVF